MTAVPVFEPATADNFFERGYLFANPDVAAHVAAGGSAVEHLHQHGQAEGRRQITRPFLADRENGRFQRFKHTINADMQGLAEGFPLSLAGQHQHLAAYLSESANTVFPPFEKEIASNPERLYLDLGCGLRDKVYPNCLYVEVYPSLSADLIVATDCTYPLHSASFDGIGCFAVLEHTKKPWVVAAEIRRMLKPGGRAYIDYPFLQPLHGFPSHYFNATREGLRSLFSEGFEVTECRTYNFQSPDWTIEWILGEFSRRLPAEKRERFLAMSVGELLQHPGLSPFWVDMLEGLPDEVLSEFACGNMLVARKIG
jgi:SAM-dependent methyltransferase